MMWALVRCATEIDRVFLDQMSHEFFMRVWPFVSDADFSGLWDDHEDVFSLRTLALQDERVQYHQFWGLRFSHLCMTVV